MPAGDFVRGDIVLDASETYDGIAVKDDRKLQCMKHEDDKVGDVDNSEGNDNDDNYAGDVFLHLCCAYFSFL